MLVYSVLLCCPNCVWEHLVHFCEKAVDTMHITHYLVSSFGVFKLAKVLVT